MTAAEHLEDARARLVVYPARYPLDRVHSHTVIASVKAGDRLAKWANVPAHRAWLEALRKWKARYGLP